MNTIRIEIANEQSLVEIDEARLRAAIQQVLTDEGRPVAIISLAILDDAAIRPLNARYLGHDCPTDVLSFVLEDEACLEGEILVSAETALPAAKKYGWSAAEELLLYVIHGALHLVGYDDATPELQSEMRARERHYLASFGLAPPT